METVVAIGCTSAVPWAVDAEWHAPHSRSRSGDARRSPAVRLPRNIGVSFSIRAQLRGRETDEWAGGGGGAEARIEKTKVKARARWLNPERLL
ncbi:MAG: hypothetical protein R3F19_20540 [Verrucomicrobiales bacterium]